MDKCFTVLIDVRTAKKVINSNVGYSASACQVAGRATAAPPIALPAHLAHRNDIDGLRAVAILLVVFFHAAPSLVPGGFVGVDIFFVISGYLISASLLEDVAGQCFSFLKFYGRRARRIFPALVLILLTVLVLGWIFLWATEFEELAKHVAAGAAFIANLVLWHEVGYFDRSAQFKPLLHLWSLGIEEQFYIFWPIFLRFFWNDRYRLLPVLILLAALSFAWNEYQVLTAPSAAFYSPMGRIWELLAGGLIAGNNFQKKRLHTGAVQLVRRMPAELSSWFGLLAILSSAFFLSTSSPFPGSMAIAPVLGAFLLLAGSPDTWINRSLLSSRAAVWVGSISYALYLWHWPLLCFLGILSRQNPSPALTLLAVLASFLMAWATTRFIEEPIRFGKLKKVKPLAIAVSLGLVGLMGTVVWSQHGMSERSVAQDGANLVSRGLAGGDGGFSAPHCELGNATDERLFQMCAHDTRERARYALIGDSKAAALYGGLVRTSLPGGRWMILGSKPFWGAVTNHF